MVYVFIAPGFEEIEALTPVDLLRRAGLPVQTVGVGSKTVVGAHDIPVVCDITQEEAVTQGLEMVVLPGGMPGAANLYGSETVRRIVTHAAGQGLWVAANCAAPVVVLHAMGLLEGRSCTCYPTMAGRLTGAGYVDAPVVVHQNFITARGPGASNSFGLALIEALDSKEKAGAIGAAFQLRP